MTLYENTTVEAIILRTPPTSSLPVSLSLDHSFYNRIFPQPPVPFLEGSVTYDLFHLYR